jgi:hypothetical protein
VIAAGGLPSEESGKEKETESPPVVESYAATGIDNALDLLDIVTFRPVLIRLQSQIQQD